jgi:hypothetical protein
LRPAARHCLTSTCSAGWYYSAAGKTIETFVNLRHPRQPSAFQHHRRDARPLHARLAAATRATRLTVWRLSANLAGRRFDADHSRNAPAKRADVPIGAMFKNWREIMEGRANIVRRAVPAGLAIMLIMVAASVLEAQPRWGRPRAPGSGACFYREANFKGDYFCAEAGDDIASMPSGMNDKISSIRTFGNVEIEVFQDTGYRGRSERFGSSVRNLKEDGWNDRLSSIHVNRLGGGRSRDSDRRDNDRRDNDRRDNDRRDNDRRDNNRGNNDRSLSGVARQQAQDIVRRAYLTVLRREPDPGSASYVDHVLRDRWTQTDVERELRKSDEYRSKGR